MTAEGGSAVRTSLARERTILNPLGRGVAVYTTDDILPRDCFVHMIRTERKRVERSKSPFSLAVFSGGRPGIDRLGRMGRLIQIIYELKRDTDVVGYLQDDSVGVLLLDTTNEGARTFADRVLARCGTEISGGDLVSFPDALLDGLLAEQEASLCSGAVIFDARPLRPFQAAVKRALDIVVAAIALVVLAPVMLVCAAAIAVTSPGPIIFRQERLGKGGAPFVINKFRSMHHHADDGVHREHVARLIAAGDDGTCGTGGVGSWTTLQNDPRVTPIGRIMRRTKLDELPQLFNVLKGDLSLVGPRPPLDYEVRQYQPWHLRRVLHTRPGITGIWQVEGDDTTTFDDMVRMDLRYVDGWSLLLDLKILAKTAAVVVRRIFELLTERSFRWRMPGWMRLAPRGRRRSHP